MAVVTIEGAGHMTVPQPIRDALGIAAGTQIVCVQSGPETFTCHVVPKPSGLRAFAEAHSGLEPAPTQEEIQEIVREGVVAEARAEEGWEAQTRAG